MKSFKKYTAVIVGLAMFSALLIHQSCVKEYHDFDKLDSEVENEWHFGTPVAYGTFSAQDILKLLNKNPVGIGDNGILLMIFEKEVPTKVGEEMLDIPTSNEFQKYHETDINGFWQPAQTYFKYSDYDTIDFNFGKGRIIDQIVIKEGTLDINIASSLAHNSDLTLKFPSITSGGSAFTKTIKSSDVSGTHLSDTSFSLAGYTIKMRHMDDPDSNQLVVDYTFDFTNSFTPIQASDSISLKASFDNMKFSYVEGYLGQESVITEGSIILETDISDGNFQFNEPILFLRSNNSFGVPVEINIDSLYATKEGDPNSPYHITFDDPTLLLNYPGLDQVGERVITDTSYVENEGIYNFDLAINNLPDNINYVIQAGTNQGAMAKDTNQFLTDSSDIDMTVGVKLPFDGTASYSFTDTMKFDLTELYKEDSKITKLLLKIGFNNGMPSVIMSQIYLANEDSVVVDSIFTSGLEFVSDSLPKMRYIAESGKINSQGKVYENTLTTTEIVKYEEDLDNYKDIKYAYVTLYFATFDIQNNTPVKIYSDYTLGIDISAEVKAYIKQEL